MELDAVPLPFALSALTQPFFDSVWRGGGGRRRRGQRRTPLLVAYGRRGGLGIENAHGFFLQTVLTPASVKELRRQLRKALTREFASRKWGVRHGKLTFVVDTVKREKGSLILSPFPAHLFATAATARIVRLTDNGGVH